MSARTSTLVQAGAGRRRGTGAACTTSGTRSATFSDYGAARLEDLAVGAYNGQAAERRRAEAFARRGADRLGRGAPRRLDPQHRGSAARRRRRRATRRRRAAEVAQGAARRWGCSCDASSTSSASIATARWPRPATACRARGFLAAAAAGAGAPARSLAARRASAAALSRQRCRHPQLRARRSSTCRPRSTPRPSASNALRGTAAERGQGRRRGRARARQGVPRRCSGAQAIDAPARSTSRASTEDAGRVPQDGGRVRGPRGRRVQGPGAEAASRGAVLAAALGIHTVEARHAAWMRYLNGVTPAAVGVRRAAAARPRSTGVVDVDRASSVGRPHDAPAAGRRGTRGERRRERSPPDSRSGRSPARRRSRSPAPARAATAFAPRPRPLPPPAPRRRSPSRRPRRLAAPSRT